MHWMVLVLMFLGGVSLRRVKRLPLNQFLRRWMSLGDWSETVPVTVTLMIHAIIRGIIKEVEVESAAAVGLLLTAGGGVHVGEETSEVVLAGTSDCVACVLFCLVGRLI